MRRALAQRIQEDGAQAFVSLMSHIWSPLMRPVLKKEGVRHTVIVHDADPHQGDRTAWVNRWLLREAQAADQVVTLTHAVAKRLIKTQRIPEEKITVLFHPDLHYAPSFRPMASDEPLRVLFFGRMLPYKGINIFVDAIEMLRQAGLPLQVGVFGQGELDERERLQAVGAEIRNEWIDPEDISAILSRHDVVVVSHTKASQSGVIAAAHGAGLPVIATPVGGLTEQVRSGFNGIIASDVTGAALASAIKSLADDRLLLHRLRRNISVSSIDRSMERFLAELSEVALGGRRPKL
jgi:glycosyltransferase involved in cell wall biosynthesis